MSISLPPRFEPGHLAQIVQIISATFVSDQQTQAAASAALQAAEAVPGFMSAMFALLEQHGLFDKNVRLGASICVRNATKRAWDVMQADDKNVVRSEIARARVLLTSPPGSEPICNTLIAVAQRLARSEWPAWDPFFTLIASLQQSSSSSSNSAPTGSPSASPTIAPETSLAAKRASAALNKILRELDTKRLSKDRRNLMGLAEAMLPQLIAPWQTTAQRVIASLHAASASGAVGSAEVVLACTMIADDGELDSLRALTKACTRLLTMGNSTLVMSEPGRSFLNGIPQVLQALLSAMRKLVPSGLIAAQQGGDLDDPHATISGPIEASDRCGIALSALFGEDDPLHKLLNRLVTGMVTVLTEHPMSCAANGSARQVGIIIAQALVASDPASALPQRVLVAGLTILTQIVDLGQKLNNGEDPLELEYYSVGGAAAAASRRSAGADPASQQAALATEKEWLRHGSSEIKSLYASIFGALQHDAWLRWIVGGCLACTHADVEKFESDGEEAALDEEVATRNDDPKKGAEALLLALVSDETHAATLCQKVIMHARNCEGTVARYITTISAGGGNATVAAEIVAALLQVEAAWLAVALTSADAIAREVLQPSLWREWCVNSLFVLAQACGLSVGNAVSTLQLLPQVHSDASLPTELARTCGHVPVGCLSAICQTSAALALRRLFFLANCCMGIMPHARSTIGANGSGPGSSPNPASPSQTGVGIGPMSTTFLLLSIQAVSSSSSPAGSPSVTAAAGGGDNSTSESVIGALRLSAITCGCALAEDCGYADAGLSNVDVLVPTAHAVYSAESQFSQMDSRLKSLDLLQKVMERCTPPVLVAAMNPLLNPLPALWAKFGEANLLRQRILAIISAVVDALPSVNTDNGDSSPRFEPAAVQGLLSSVCPLIAVACDVSSPDGVYLSDEGLSLWDSVIECAPLYSPQLHALFPLLPALVRDSPDNVRIGMRVVAAYAIRAGSALLQPGPDLAAAAGQQWAGGYGPVLASVFSSVVGQVKPIAVPAVTSALDTVLSALPQHAPALLSELWGRIALSLALGAAERQQQEAQDAVGRNALMAALNRKSTGGGHGISLSADMDSGGAIDVGNRGDLKSGVGSGAGNASARSPREPLSEADPNAASAYAACLARAFVIDSDVVLSSLGHAASAYPAVLVKSGLLADPAQDGLSALAHALAEGQGSQAHAGASSTLASAGISQAQVSSWLGLRLLCGVYDTWINSAKDVGGSSAGSSSESNGSGFGFDSDTLPALWSNKLLAMACTLALRVGSFTRLSLQSRLAAAVQSNPTGAGLTQALASRLSEPACDITSATAGRVDALGALCGEVDAGLAVALRGSGSSAAGTSIPGVTGSPLRKASSLGVGTSPMHPTRRGNSLMSDGSRSAAAGGGGGNRMLARAHELLGLEPEEDAHLRFGGNPQGSGAAGAGAAGADDGEASELTSARQRVFASQPEVSTDLHRYLSSQLSGLRDMMTGAMGPAQGQQGFQALVLARLPPQLLKQLQG